MAVAPPDVARSLRELIAALDQRTPHIERSGEAAIARDAAALRERAVKRLREITDPPTAAVGASDRSSELPTRLDS